MIPLEQGSVFRQDMHKAPTVEKPASQSLWNRAVSFDLDLVKGKVSVEKSQSLWNRAVSSDLIRFPHRVFQCGLNPFGTGQCLPTPNCWLVDVRDGVSIPLEQGSVFRQLAYPH